MCYFVTAPGVLRAVVVGLRVLWVDEVKECLGHFICVWVDLVSFMFRSIMTRVMASSEDLNRLGEFFEGARLVFLTVPVGASMAYVNSLFWRLAATGRRTLPAGVWVGVRVRSISAFCSSPAMGAAAVADSQRGDGCAMCPCCHRIARNLR